MNFVYLSIPAWPEPNGKLHAPPSSEMNAIRKKSANNTEISHRGNAGGSGIIDTIHQRIAKITNRMMSEIRIDSIFVALPPVEHLNDTTWDALTARDQ